MSITDTMFLQVDKLGNNPNNLITLESHILPSNIGKIIKPNFLAYYTDSLIVKSIDLNNNQVILNHLTDYTYTDHFHNISSKVGKQVCGAILINPSITNTEFEIQYQAYGGLDHPDIKQIAIAIASRLQTNPIEWNSIIDKPSGFNPAHHLHDWLDLYGLEYIVLALQGIKQAINNSPSYKQLGLSSKIQAIFNSHPINTNVIEIDNTHPFDLLNIHRTSKYHVGLGNVQNHKIFESYTPLSNNQLTGSLFTDYNQSSQVRYITPISAASYIIETIELTKQTLYTNPNSLVYNLNSNLNSIDNKANDTLIIVNNNTNAINLLNNSIALTKSKCDQIALFTRRYKLLNYNEELAIILKGASQHKYNSTQTYSSLYNVPVKLPNLYLWIDFSDISKLTLDNSVTANSVSSITDKSNFSRVFSQPNQSNRPVLIQNNQLGNSQINKNNSANISTGKYLIQTSGLPINIFTDCTIISLYKNKNTENVLLSNSINNDTLNGHLENRSVSLLTNKYILKSSIGSSLNYTSTLAVLNISNASLNDCWIATNDYYNSNDVLGLQTKTRTSVSSFSFNTIGSMSKIHDYELAEILVYNRQLSTKEVDAINKYLSKKWSGITDFNISTSFVNNNI